MKKKLGTLVLKIFGWKVKYPEQYTNKKCVMVVAPHTSNWDLVFALATFWKIGIPMHYFIKDNYTKSIVGGFFKWTGAIGVDRKNFKNRAGLVDYAADLLKKSEKMVLLVPAEGSRSRVNAWKTGFYRIALKANVPIAMAYGDYENKIAGVGDMLLPSGDFKKDMQYIQDFYKDIKGKYPEKYNPKIF